MKIQNKKIEQLKEYFAEQPAIVLAFLFGSYATGRAMEESDFDVGIYVKNYPATSVFELRGRPEKVRKIESGIGRGITRIVDKDVNLIIMNKAPASLVSNIFKTGIPLAVKDKKLYWELYLKVSSEAEDFLRFLIDFRRIKQEAKSLSKEEEARLRVRVDYLENRMKEILKFQKITWDEFREDMDKRRNIERWAETILNAVIDIAKIILASEKQDMPRGYEGALLYFGMFVGLGEEKADILASFADLRNILAHEYLEVLYDRLQDFIRQFPALYEKISEFLEEYLDSANKSKIQMPNAKSSSKSKIQR